MTSREKSFLPQFPVLVGKCLGYEAYRGYGPLAELARISKADIFDQKKNRAGTQRNLSVQHARSAYQYVADKEEAFYPEMVLNIRDKSFVRFTRMSQEGSVEFGMLEFIKDPSQAAKIVVSRLDGNHRLWFVDGREHGMEPVDRLASVCFLMLEDLEAELELFRDINDNQMGMNTSHLQNITARLLGERVLKVQNPALYIVQKLQRDKTSPLYGRIHEGGVVRKGATLGGLTIANLTSAVRDMLGRSAKLGQFPDADAQYRLIKNYWAALKKWLPKAWKNPRGYMIFKGAGLYAISYVGIEVIDRALLKGRFSSDDMLEYLKQLPPEALASKEALPFAGRSGGRKMANDLISNLEEEGQVSVARLQKLILSGD